MKRIFLAILISPEIKKQVAVWRAEHEDLPVRWIAEENLHVTVAAPWEEKNPDEIAGKLENIRGKIAPFEISFQRIEYGPNPRRPRLIWAVGEANESLVDLQKEIIRILDMGPMDRRIRPHSTLARLRPENRFRFPHERLDENISWIERVETVCLMESILEPEGAVYKILKKINL